MKLVSHPSCIHCLLVLLSVALLCTMASADDTEEDLLQKAAQDSARGNVEQAIGVLTEVITKNPKQSLAFYLRGRENFRAGKIKESVSDLDKHVELEPKAESRQWERGISYYYAGEFEKGAKQFELYQTFHDQDVENSTWRYLCVARQDGVDKAVKNLLPITDDRRVPMMQIYDLYRGKLKPADVLAAAEAGEPSKEALNQRLFYAHLYIGLWHEAAGEKALAKKHILEAEKHKIGHYMWDVAHVHADLLRAPAKEEKKKE
ncbi:MAG: tetratricopeptide repeat protein [Pirellulaceae bacterium]